MRNLVTQNQLKELFNYNADSGIFTRLITTGPSSKKGDIVGCLTSTGYLGVNINKKTYLLHRLAFVYMNDELPEIVDHINGIRTDNSWNNLRNVNRSQNGCNVGVRKSSKSGVKGVTWCTRYSKWRVDIGFQGKSYNFGYYADLEMAKQRVIIEREKLHKEFAVHK